MDHRAVCPHDMTFGMIVDRSRSIAILPFVWSSEWDVSWIQRNLAILRESNMAGWEIHVINEACHRKTTENGACSSHVWVLDDLMLQTSTNPGRRGQTWDLLRKTSLEKSGVFVTRLAVLKWPQCPYRALAVLNGRSILTEAYSIAVRCHHLAN